jgi:hypothetical protein
VRFAMEDQKIEGKEHKNQADETDPHP